MTRRASFLGPSVFAWIAVLAVLLFAPSAKAAPEAHILRIDPRAGIESGQPLLTTVIELVQFTPMSEVVTNAGCGQAKGDALLDCISGAVEQKNAMWKAFPFNEGNARLLVRVDGGENPAKFNSKATWAASAKDPLVGTAWLIALDASSLMGPRYADAREVANQFIGALGPNDIAKLVIFDDRISPYVANSSWVPASQKATLVNILTANSAPSPSHQRGRPFFNQIKNITKSFGDLGNAGNIQNIPLHQAMVLLSNGSGREDAGSAALGAEAMKQYFNKGRFPEDNPLSPKTPLPVISIYFPNARGFANDLYASNDMQFMQDLANPEIGGFFDIVRTGQGVPKATTILSLVKSRFNSMWVVKWRLACLASTAEQTFNLVFQNTTPAVKPDGTFKDVPIGVNPGEWPLDINVAQTKAEAEANPVHPGGEFRVYGDFCWTGEKQRAEAYFVPAGTQPTAAQQSKNDPDAAKKAMQHLIAQNMRGSAEEASETFVKFKAPDEEKILEGTGDATVTRLVVYDNKAKRASGTSAETVLTLKAGKKPFNWPIILGAAGIVVVILLLVVVLLRGGGGGKGKRSNQPPPAPVVAGGGGYGGGAPPYQGGGGQYPPPGGYGGGGGYGASAPETPQVPYQPAGFDPPAPAYQPPAYQPPAPVYQPPVPAYQPPAPVVMAAMAPPQAPLAAPQPAYSPPAPPIPVPEPGGGGHPLAGAGSAPIQVRCPACGSTTLATPGLASVCFSCGQPLPKDAAPVAVDLNDRVPSFPLTGAMQSQLEPPPNPYGSTVANGASIIGASGQFSIRAGVEVKVGRDPAQCPITLSEPRVSGVHATLKFENGQLFVRDEGSNNGTYVGQARIAAQTWTPVTSSSTLRFGPVEFRVRLE